MHHNIVHAHIFVDIPACLSVNSIVISFVSLPDVGVAAMRSFGMQLSGRHWRGVAVTEVDIHLGPLLMAYDLHKKGYKTDDIVEEVDAYFAKKFKRHK